MASTESKTSGISSSTAATPALEAAAAAAKAFGGQRYLVFMEATLEDFYRLQEQKAEFLEQGILVMHSPATLEHEKLFRDLLTEMHLFVRQHDLGEVLGSRYTIVLGDHRFEPDIVFISRANPGKFTELEFIGTPDLVVEILSKTTRDYDLNTKRQIYQQHGIPEIVFIDLIHRTIIANFREGQKYHTRKATRKRIESKVLKGFEFGGYW